MHGQHGHRGHHVLEPAIGLEPADAPAENIGLTDTTLQNAAESRLRSDRLFDAESSQSLYVNVNLLSSGSAFGVSVELYRYVDDTGFGNPGVVSVWNYSSVGTYGGDGQYVLGIVSEGLDGFLTEYLRANEGACE